MTKTELQKIIGTNVQRYRINRKMTQEDLAVKVNINASTITRIENGQRMMSVPTLTAVAKALGVSCDALLQSEEITSQHIKNISFLLEGQSGSSLRHVEHILTVLIEEYGEKELEMQIIYDIIFYNDLFTVGGIFSWHRGKIIF